MKNKIEKGKHYFLKINVFGREIEYEGEIVSLNEREFGLRTEEACNLRFNLKDLIYFKKIEKPKKDLKIVVNKKISKENLKEPDKPKF
jgi:hypothetical protein